MPLIHLSAHDTLHAAVLRSSKVTPVINQEYLKTLEDMIIQRIKDSNFDNLVLAAAGHKNEFVAGKDQSPTSALFYHHEHV